MITVGTVLVLLGGHPHCSFAILRPGERHPSGGVPRRVTTTLPRRIDKAQLDAMRSWAVEHGYQVSRRGRVPQHVQDAYQGSRHGA